MESAGHMISEGLALGMMAFALGMDAFSVCMGMGMLKLSLRQIAKMGAIIGFFHAIMPLMGMLIGKILSEYFGKIAGMAGGMLLVLLGSQMIIEFFKKDNEQMRFVQPAGIGFILFAISVSLDSFSVGLSLGIYGAKMLVTIVLFGLASMVLAWAGLLLAQKTQKFLGRYSEAFGGVILLVIGLKLLFHLHL